MPRTLLISQEDGRALKTYGVKKVRANMKFSFIISVVIVFLWGGVTSVDSRTLNVLNYLEYLNDFDRRNVEHEDIHKQWPFQSVAKTLNEDEEIIPEDNPIDRTNLLQVVSIAREGMTNKQNQNYRDILFDKLEDGFKHMRDLTDRSDQLSQYRRYKPFEQEVLEEARMYPERNGEEISFNEDDDNAYENPDINFEEKDEELTELRPSLHRPFFPRIAPVEKPANFESAFEDSGESEEDEEEEADEIPNLKPTFPKAYFPRIAPVDIPVNYKIDDLEFSSDNNNHMHHEHEDYKFRDGEEFPHSIAFDEVPVAENPSEFGVKPSDPRFYRDALQTENTITIEPKQDPVHSYHLETPFVSKSKMNSRSDSQQQLQSSLPSDEENRSYESKDVEVVPFKPDSQEDTAGVYIIAIVAGISAAATVGLIAVGIGWYNLQKHMKNAEDADYPSYGIVGPNKDYEKKDRDDVGDRRLAQSAQMYHYQHQKQQIIAMGRNPQGHGSQSDTEEEEDEEGNYTVYECPGLASIEGPLEVKNPMFDDDQLATPSQTPSKMTNAENTK